MTVIADPIRIFQKAHGFSKGQAVRLDVITGLYALACANSNDNARVIGVVNTFITPDYFILSQHGDELIRMVGLNVGKVYYLSATNPGEVALTPPSSFIREIYQATETTRAKILLNYVSSESSTPSSSEDLQEHIDDPDAAHAASAISFVPTGSISTYTVQGAIAQLDVALDTEATIRDAADVAGAVATALVAADLATHLSNPTDAHDASAISVIPTGSLISTDAQSAFAELDSDVAGVASDLSDHITDAVGAHAASAISNDPSGTIAATTVQAAIDELDTEKATTGSVSAVVADLAAHIVATTGAHAGTAISITPAGTIASTDVQGAIYELDTEKATTGSVATVASDLAAHIADTTDAHAGTAITYTPGGALVSTNVNAAIDELETLITGGGVADADYGDIVVSSSGTVWTIDSSVLTTAARTVTDDATVADMVNTLGGAASTGTGGLVRITNAALITPDLGTPTALVGTNISGTASGLNIGGNAATATLATTATLANTVLVADAAGDTTMFVMLAGSATGSLPVLTDAGLAYNATTNALTATTFIGALTGNADTATLATSVTTNANLTGVITSVGNATSIASQTGTGTKFVVDNTPTLITPVLGVATATTINRLTFTQPATGSTLTINDGFTLTVTANASVAGTHTGTSSGTNTGDQTITLTGNVTGSGTGSFATTIAAGVVTLAMMANLAQDQFIGRVTTSTGVPETATITAAARTVLDDTTVDAMITTLGGAAYTGTGGIVRATSPGITTPNIVTSAGFTINTNASIFQADTAFQTSSYTTIGFRPLGSTTIAGLRFNTVDATVAFIDSCLYDAGGTFSSGTILHLNYNGAEVKINSSGHAIASSSTTTGSLIVSGGVGISGATSIGGKLGVGGDVGTYMITATGGSTGTLINAISTINAASGIYGCVVTHNRGTANVVNGDQVDAFFITSDSTTTASSVTSIITHTTVDKTHATRTSSMDFWTTNSGTLAKNMKLSGNVLSILTGVASTSTTTGSLLVTGGVGITGTLCLDGTSGSVMRITNGVANGTVPCVLTASKGPTGSTAALVGWIRINVGGTDRYQPYW